MRDATGLNTIVADLQMAFGGKIRPLNGRRPNEVYLETRRESIAAIAARLYKLRKIRLAMVFGIDRRQEEGVFYLQYAFACDRAGGFILIRTPVPATDPEFPSLTPVIPAVNWQEREIQDWFGLTAAGHPNPRRVALHDDFPDKVYPLRKDFDVFSKPQPLRGPRHLFRPVEGEGVFQVPVGPIHAGIIEPGHFRFSVAGEPVLYLQIRLFYTHKATEKLFEHKPLSQAVFLAESISGDSSFSHSTAFCQAIESLAHIEVPRRARLMRTVLLELERLYNNPFYENLDPGKKIDECVELSLSLYDQYIRMAREWLAEAPSGTRVVTFHGMGGDMPDGYERVLQEFRDIGFVELWIKNPSPEELISFQRVSSKPEDLHAPCLSAPGGASEETRLWISICASTPDTAHGSED